MEDVLEMKDYLDRDLVAELAEKISPEELATDYMQWQIYGSITQRMESARYFYNNGQDLAGEQQMVLALSSFHKLRGEKVAANALDEWNKQIHVELNRQRVA